MAIIVNHPTDSALAERLRADLAAITEPAVVVLVSAKASHDAAFEGALIEAIEGNQRIIPVLVEAVPLPPLIEHLRPVDFSEDYAIDDLVARLEAAPGEMHMKVHTPRTMASNRRVGVVVGVMALIMFVVGLYGVGVLGLQAPAEEYEAVETEIIQTRNAYIDAALPRSTEDAASFQATVENAAPTLRPILAATATAIAGD